MRSVGILGPPNGGKIIPPDIRRQIPIIAQNSDRQRLKIDKLGRDIFWRGAFSTRAATARKICAVLSGLQRPRPREARGPPDVHRASDLAHDADSDTTRENLRLVPPGNGPNVMYSVRQFPGSAAGFGKKISD